MIWSSVCHASVFLPLCVEVSNSTEVFTSSSILSILSFRRRYLSFLLDGTGALVCFDTNLFDSFIPLVRRYLEGLVLGRVE